jgi:hypothetical protein
VRAAPDGKWRELEVRSPGVQVVFETAVVAGCRYRARVELKTLPRALLEVGPRGGTLYESDTGQDASTEIEWYADLDGAFEARVKGFSAHTGRARLRLETLGPDGEPVAAHRRFLATTTALAQHGDLAIGEPDRWDLVVVPGRAYRLTTQPGSAGRVSLRVVGAAGVLAEAGPTVGAPYPTLPFLVPEDAAVLPLRLEVRGLDSGGGTYAVRLADLPPGPWPEPPPEPPAVERGLVPGAPLVVRLGAGDVAVLFVPSSHPMNPHGISLERDGRWEPLSPDPVSVLGARASMRTPEDAALCWFRAYAPGTYRFEEPRPEEAVVSVHPAEVVTGAPLLLGTEVDALVRAKGGSEWRAIGLGVCMPGWDYLFVAVGPRQSLDMRVRDADGAMLASRGTRGVALTHVAGMGPSLRFRMKAPGLVRLEVKGRGWEGYGLLRRASN